LGKRSKYQICHLVPEVDEEPEITVLDKLQTFVGNKRHKEEL